jgi:hypothetical protein
MQPKVWLKGMKKKLNIDRIQNELHGGSAFFPGYKSPDSPIPPSQEVKQGETVATPPPANNPGDHLESVEGVPPTLPPPVRGPVPPSLPLVRKVKRPIRQRQPFDIYEDQYQQLKRIADTEREFVNGRSMSHMVREAIDQYFSSHPSPKKEPSPKD